MATVRLTESLQDSIISNAKNLFAKRLQEAQAYPPEYNDGDFIFDAYLDANPDQRRVLLDMAALKWGKRYPEIRVNIFGNMTTLRFAKPRTAYCGWAENWTSERIVITADNVPALRDLHDKLVQRQQAIKALEAERDAFAKKVEAILDRCSTLKQALGIWPGLWELVPQDVRNKHNEVAVRTKREQDDTSLEVDLDALNGAVVVAKIVEGVI